MGSVQELLVLLLMRTRSGVAFGVPCQEPAIAGLEVANYCVSSHMICFFHICMPKSCGDVQGEAVRMLCASKEQSEKKNQNVSFP